MDFIPSDCLVADLEWKDRAIDSVKRTRSNAMTGSELFPKKEQSHFIPSAAYHSLL
jgi:hypothetical protein